MSFVESITLNADGNAEDKFQSVAASVRDLYGDIAKLAGFAGLFEMFKKVTESGIEANQMIQENRLAVGSMIQVFNTYNGEALSFSAATKLAADAQEQLKVAAFASGTEIDKLLEAFRSIYPAAVQAGLSTGQMVEMTQTLAIVAKVTGNSLDQVTSTIVRMMLGFGGVRSEFGLMVKSMGITPEAIKEWRVVGDVFGQITQRLQVWASMGPTVQQTWSGLLATIKNINHELLETSFAPLFDALKTAMSQFASSFAQISGGVVVISPEMQARLKMFVDGLVAALPHVLGLADALIRVGAAVMGSFGGAIQVFSPFLDVLTAILRVAAPLIDTYGEWALVGLGLFKVVGLLEGGLVAVAAALASNTALAVGSAGAWGSLTTILGAIITPLGAAALGIAAVSAALLYYFNAQKKAEESMAGSAEEAAKWTFVMDAQNAGAKAAVAGNQALANGYQDLADKVRKGQMPLGDAILAFRKLRTEMSAAALAALDAPADPAKIEKIGNAIAKITEQIQGADYTGVSKKLFDAAVQINGKIRDLQSELLHMVSPEERAMLQTQIDAERDLLVAKRGAILHEATVADEKRVQEVRKAWDDVAEAAETGSRKELLAILDKAKQEMQASHDRIKAAEHDAESIEKITDEEKQKQLAIVAKMNDQIFDAEKKLADKTADLKFGFDSEVLKSNGEDFEAELLTIGNTLAVDLRGLSETYGGLLYAPIELIYGAQGKFGAAMTEATRKHGVALAGMRGDWATYADDLARQMAKGQITMSEFYSKLGSEQQRWAVTAGDGWDAAWHSILGTVKTTGQAVGDFVTSVWHTIGQGFSDSVYAVITGKAHSLVDVLKGVWDSILKSFSDMIGKMIEKWISSQLVMSVSGGAQGGTGNAEDWNMSSGGGVNFSSGMGYGVGAIGLGLGLTGLANAQTTGQKIGSGLEAAGGVAAMIPGIGWVVGAIMVAVGALINALSHPPEIKLPVHVGEDISKDPRSAESQALLQSYGHMLGGLADIAQAGGGNVKDVLSILRGGDTPDEFFRSQQVTIHAGSQEDIQKDWEAYVSKYMPQAMMSFAFGRQITGQSGDNAPGSPGVRSQPIFGNIDFAKDTTPIVKMLQGLGFVNEKIQDIAGQIDVRDPDDFVKWLTALVTVVKGFNDLSVDLDKTTTDWFAQFAKEATTSPGASFQAAATNITSLAETLSAYVGDEQLSRAQQVLQLGQQFRDQQVAYLKELYALQQSIIDSVSGQIRGMKLDLMTPAQQAAFLGAEVQTAMGQLSTATTKEQVAALMQTIEQDLGQIWSINKTAGSATGGLESYIEGLLGAAQTAANLRISQFADDALAPNSELGKAMVAAAALFTNAGTSASGMTTATHNATTATNNAATAMSFAAASASAAAGALNNFTAAVRDAAIAASALPAIGAASETNANAYTKKTAQSIWTKLRQHGVVS